MAATITVRRSIPDFEARDVQSYDMVLEVLSAVDMPKEIFIFQRGIAPAYEKDGEPTDMFVAVADPVDLEEMPTTPDSPIIDQPFYRSDKVTLRFRSVTDLEECWAYISSDITGLVAALNSGVEGGSTEDIVYA